MKHNSMIYLLAVVATIIMVTNCTRHGETKQGRQPQDTLYTQKAAMMVYDYDPVRALQIIDSAVIVKNLSNWRSDKNRARIYCLTRMGERFDSLMHWTANARFDSAKAIGERLLKHDSVMNSLEEQQDVLEMLAYTARQQHDSMTWLQRSQQLAEVCRQQGSETEALSNEAEVGAALCRMGRQNEGVAMLDSVIAVLSEINAQGDEFKFNELDALVIALKRKIGVMTAKGQAVEILPLARRIVTMLDDYEQHPDRYHDGTYREPPAEKRTDYIHFYRSQAENFIAAAYTALGNTDDMEVTFERLENITADAKTREHIARYHAMEQQMLRQQAESHSRMMTIIAIASVISLLLILIFATYAFFQNRRIRQKNQVLIRQMNHSLSMEPTPVPKPSMAESSADEDDTSALFQTIDHCIRSERLYANANIQRQDICDRFNLRREMLNQLLTTHAGGQSFPNYINGIRLSEACQLLKENPEKTVVAIADEVGLSPRYLRRLFFEQYGVTPTEYRAGLPRDT